MEEFEGAVVIVKAKQPLIDWTNSVNKEVTMTLADCRRESTVYVIPEYYSNEAGRRYIKLHYKEIFEEELNGYWEDEDAWPKNRTYKMFLEWFEVEFHSLVMDLRE